MFSIMYILEQIAKVEQTEDVMQQTFFLAYVGLFLYLL